MQGALVNISLILIMSIMFLEYTKLVQYIKVLPHEHENQPL